jgi:phenol hydroxylase P1 protein
MKDWYAFKDPRQFYYGAYTLARAACRRRPTADFDFVEADGAGRQPTPELKRRCSSCCCPCAMWPGAPT